MVANGQPQVVVIGGGPSGSTAATLVAQQGYRVELFEREFFPRFHIGESLIPETYHVIKRLGMLDKMKGAISSKSTACNSSTNGVGSASRFTSGIISRTSARIARRSLRPSSSIGSPGRRPP